MSNAGAAPACPAPRAKHEQYRCQPAIVHHLHRRGMRSWRLSSMPASPVQAWPVPIPLVVAARHHFRVAGGARVSASSRSRRRGRWIVRRYSRSAGDPVIGRQRVDRGKQRTRTGNALGIVGRRAEREHQERTRRRPRPRASRPANPGPDVVATAPGSAQALGRGWRLMPTGRARHRHHHRRDDRAEPPRRRGRPTISTVRRLRVDHVVLAHAGGMQRRGDRSTWTSASPKVSTCGAPPANAPRFARVGQRRRVAARGDAGAEQVVDRGVAHQPAARQRAMVCGSSRIGVTRQVAIGRRRARRGAVQGFSAMVSTTFQQPRFTSPLVWPGSPACPK